MRPIDADALDKRVYEEIPLKYFNGSLKTMSFVRELIKDAPTLSPDDVRGVGEWIKYAPHNSDMLVCSVCEKYWILDGDQYDFRYCPSCGARMKGVKGVSEDA